jgi:hypothetical protein
MAASGAGGAKKQWTLDGARAMVGEVHRRTAEIVPEVEQLMAEREALAPDAAGRADLEAQIRVRVGRWARAMEALGAEVKGLWLVDFDNGSGYYCWRWPEESLDWFHGYEDGFAGRVRIQ